MRRCRVAQWLLAAFVAGSSVHGYAQDQEIVRGKALYDARCDQCHEKSVHERDPRSAKSFAEVRAYVVKWDKELGALWRADELDAVTRYLNDRYYHYPCPTTLCSLERAHVRTSMVRGGTP